MRATWTLALAACAASLSFAQDETWTPPQEADLPAGFPPPTPPGEIQVKHYPESRAVIRQETGFLALGPWKAFYPLFNHIKSEKIAMTAPVLAVYPEDAQDAWLGKMQVGFFYPSPETGETGKGDGVKTVDLPASTCLSIGVTGPYNMETFRDSLAKLQQWFDENGEGWKIAGPPRRLMYQQPTLSKRSKLYSEVEIPIERDE